MSDFDTMLDEAINKMRRDHAPSARVGANLPDSSADQRPQSGGIIGRTRGRSQTADAQQPERRSTLTLNGTGNREPGATAPARGGIIARRRGTNASDSDTGENTESKPSTVKNANTTLRSNRGAAQEWLLSALADGPLPAKQIAQQARDNGIAKRTLARAKKDAGVQSIKVRRAWHWVIPPQECQECQSAGDGNLQSQKTE